MPSHVNSFIVVSVPFGFTGELLPYSALALQDQTDIRVLNSHRIPLNGQFDKASVTGIGFRYREDKLSEVVVGAGGQAGCLTNSMVIFETGCELKLPVNVKNFQITDQQHGTFIVDRSEPPLGDRFCSPLFRRVFYSERAENGETAQLTAEFSTGDRNLSMGWVNPIVCEIALNNNECPQFDSADRNGSNEIQDVLARQWQGSRLIHAEPKLPASADLKASFLAAWWELVKEKDYASWTLIERLVFGVKRKCDSQYNLCPWVPFLALDFLGGSWCIKNFGAGNPTFLWIPGCANVSSNETWLRQYLLKCWGGEPGTPKDRRKPIKRPEALITSTNSNYRQHDDATSFLGDIRKYLDEPTRELLVAAVEKAKVNDCDGYVEAVRGPFEHSLYGRDQLLKQLGRMFLPASPIEVDLPRVAVDEANWNDWKQLTKRITEQNLELKKLCMNLIESRGGEFGMALADIARAAVSPSRQASSEPIKLGYNRRNWWFGEWFRAVQFCPANSKLDFVPEGFMLDFSKLDEDVLFDADQVPHLIDETRLKVEH